ncbi:MAG: YkgJ family cysteine cluster protein [Verrucomicrobia bacterium]|nr:YkgJ family cysteine cluster protein [Verrucomicrobiota bacterium]MCH8525855.1 YkgJ family cysteine cluster protein [Kiritimatiellia bacterium]
MNDFLIPEYLRGVRFSCTECGACCTGEPGRVRVSREELARIVLYRGESADEALPEWAIREGDEVRIRERENGDCVFFEENRCSIHAVKPGQCRRYPFWFRNVRSEAAWAKTCAECPGIGEGPPVDPEEILRRVGEDLDAE